MRLGVGCSQSRTLWLTWPPSEVLRHQRAGMGRYPGRQPPWLTGVARLRRSSSVTVLASGIEVRGVGVYGAVHCRARAHVLLIALVPHDQGLLCLQPVCRGAVGRDNRVRSVHDGLRRGGKELCRTKFNLNLIKKRPPKQANVPARFAVGVTRTALIIMTRYGVAPVLAAIAGMALSTTPSWPGVSNPLT